VNVRRYAKGTITAITHQNMTAEMALQYRYIIITAASLVEKGVVDVKENASWERPKIHAVPLVRYMGKGTEGLQKMRGELEVENEGVAVRTQVRWLENHRTISERSQNGEIATSSVVIVVKGNKVAQSRFRMGIKVAGVWYRVETYTNAGPDTWCGLCWGWGHFDHKCSV